MISERWQNWRDRSVSNTTSPKAKTIEEIANDVEAQIEQLTQILKILRGNAK